MWIRSLRGAKAIAVRDYLVTTWNIDPTRLIISTYGRSEKPIEHGISGSVLKKIGVRNYPRITIRY